MSQELFYTSAPNGLRPGSNGFCTVAMTAGLSATVAQRLEILSGYRELFPPGDPRTDQNPIAWSHWRLNLSGRAVSVLSRVCYAGMDYTQRTNTFAHHILLDNSEQPVGGPAWLISQPEIMESEWTGSPRLLSSGRVLPNGDDAPRVCTRWAELTGDAGWAGVLAGAAFPDPSRIAYIIYAAGTTILPLIREAMALLPQRLRWQVGFCTYFTELPASGSCAWRCCVAGTQAAKEAARLATSGIVIDLTRPLGAPPENPSVDAGRIGRLIHHEIEATAAPMPLRPRPMPPPSDRPIPIQVAPDAHALPHKQAVAAGVDQSWMPPANATVIERERPEAGQSALRSSSSSHPRPVFWIVALLWPLLVITAVVAWHFFYAVPTTIVDLQATKEKLNANLTQAHQQLESDHHAIDTLNQQISDQKGQLDKKSLQVDGRDREIVTLKATTQTSQKVITDKDGEIVTLKATTQTSEKVIGDKNGEIAGLNSKLAETTANLAETTKRLSDSVQHEKATSGAPQKTQLEPKARVLFLDVLASPPTLIIPVAPDTKMVVKSRPPPSGIEVSRDNDTSPIILRSSSQSKDNKIAIAEVSDGALRWTWQSTIPTQRDNPALTAWFRSLCLELSDSTGAVTSVSVAPIRQTASIRAKVPFKIAAEAGQDLRLMPCLTRVGTWQIETSSETALRLTSGFNPRVSFTISIGEGSLNSEWQNCNSQWQSQTDRSGRYLATLQTDLDKTQADMTELVKQIEEEKDDGKKEAIKKSLKEKREQRDATESQLFALKAVDALKNIPDFSVYIISRETGAVVAIVTLQPS